MVLGEDDKSWAGAFGAWISAGVLRVKSEISAASGDEYSDVETSTAEERKQGVTSFLRHLQEEHRDSLKFMLTSSEADKPGGKHQRLKFCELTIGYLNSFARFWSQIVPTNVHCSVPSSIDDDYELFRHDIEN